MTQAAVVGRLSMQGHVSSGFFGPYAFTGRSNVFVHVSKTPRRSALSQTCHFALFVNPVARASTDCFFTFCDVHLEHERDLQATCLQRRHEQLAHAAGARWCALWQERVFRAPHCRRAAAHTAGGQFLATLTTCL